MDKGIIIGSFSGLAIFIVIVLLIIYSHSDFNQQLVSSVESGTPIDQLVPQIYQEHYKECLNAKSRLESQTMDMSLWGNGELAPDSYYAYYTKNYEEEVDYYNKLEDLRIKFAKRQISKEEFLNKVETKNF